MITIRKYKIKDEKEIIDICFETRSSELKDLDNREVFGLRWAQCYLKFYPDFCFVALENNEVIGYILSTPDTKEQEKVYVENIIPIIKNKIAEDYKYYEMFTAFIPENDMLGEILNPYPAHLHINLTAKCRHKGIGSKLMNAMENNLKAKGITAVHLGVMKDNEAAYNFYRKHGYQTITEYDFGDNSIGCFMGKVLS